MLLNKIVTVQAFHNNVNLSQFEQLSLDPQTKEKAILTQPDRALVVKRFQKHIQEIFNTLGTMITERKFEEFFAFAGENVKNLAVRLGKQGAMDKKVEKQIKATLLQDFKEPLDKWVAGSTDFNIKDVVAECKKGSALCLNFMLIVSNCFLGFTGENTEDWQLNLLVQALSAVTESE